MHWLKHATEKLAYIDEQDLELVNVTDNIDDVIEVINRHKEWKLEKIRRSEEQS